MPSVRLGWNQQHFLVIAEEFVPRPLPCFSPQIGCSALPVSVSHSGPWLLLSSSWRESSPASCRRTSSRWLVLDKPTPGKHLRWDEQWHSIDFIFFFYSWNPVGLTSPNPPFPRALYCRNACLVTGCLEEKDTQSQTGNRGAGCHSQWTSVKFIWPLHHLPLEETIKVHAVLVLTEGLSAEVLMKGPCPRKWELIVIAALPHTHTRMLDMQREKELTYSRQAWKTSEQGSASRLWLQLCSWLSRVETHWLDWEKNRFKRACPDPVLKGHDPARFSVPPGRKDFQQRSPWKPCLPGRTEFPAELSTQKETRACVCLRTCVCLLVVWNSGVRCALVSLSDLFDEEPVNYSQAKLSPLLIGFCLKVFLKKEERREWSSSSIYMHSLCTACRL